MKNPRLAYPAKKKVLKAFICPGRLLRLIGGSPCNTVHNKPKENQVDDREQKQRNSPLLNDLDTRIVFVYGLMIPTKCDEIVTDL
jgi:hypothetical protein